jgi:hypothetical protein
MKRVNQEKSGNLVFIAPSGFNDLQDVGIDRCLIFQKDGE